MIRRKPTLVELTPDDVQEYEALKRQAEEKKRLEDLERKKRLGSGASGGDRRRSAGGKGGGDEFEADFNSEEAKAARAREAAQRRKDKRHARMGL